MRSMLEFFAPFPPYFFKFYFDEAFIIIWAARRKWSKGSSQVTPLAREEEGEGRRLPWSSDSQYALVGALMERPCLTILESSFSNWFLQQKFVLCLCEAILTTSILQFECNVCSFALQPTHLCVPWDIWVINLVTLIPWNNLLVNGWTSRFREALRKFLVLLK